MSFNLNPLNNNEPQIRTTKTTDGSAGNLGYFNQGRKKENEDETSNEKSVFGDAKEEAFTLKDAQGMMYQEPPLLLKIVDTIKSFFKNLFHQ